MDVDTLVDICDEIMNFLTVCNSCGTFSFAWGGKCAICIHMQMSKHHLWMFDVDDLSNGWCFN